MKKLSILAMCLCMIITVTACQSNDNEKPIESTGQPSVSESELHSSAHSKAEGDLPVSSEQTAFFEDEEEVSGASEDLSELETQQSKGAAASQEGAPHSNPFTLDSAGGYDLYIYNGQMLSYVPINYGWLQPIDLGPEFKAAVAAINNLPVLEQVDKIPNKNADYGLMSVMQDYAKTQYYFYEDLLTVNGTAYAITNEQYDVLKTAMETELLRGGLQIPQWFVYMNPNRVTSVQSMDEKGEMREVRNENVLLTAVSLRYIDIESVKTYSPGTKNLDKLPFKVVYTFDSGITYTVYASDDTPRTSGVNLYVESSDMNYACEYAVSGYISSYLEYTREAIYNTVNPWTM